jgi:hypothetical protein
MTSFDTLTLLAVLLVSAVLVVAPPVAVWRACAKRAEGNWGWLGTLFALLAPFLGAYLAVVLLWLPGYQGQCGGWLGEAAPCRGVGQYVAETMVWAALSMAVPGLFGMLVGMAVWVLHWAINRRSSGPDGK